MRKSDPGQRRASGTLGKTRGKATILIAEDDEDLRVAVQSILVDDGFEVIAAATGNAALEYLANAADDASRLPDVLLLDFVLPGFSGLGVLRVMRRFRRAPATILMTAFPDPSVESFARSLGAVRVLRKPIDERELHAALADALASSTRATRGG